MHPPQRRRLAAALAVPALTAALLAGCGSGDSASTASSQAPAATATDTSDGDNGLADKSAEEILAAAREGLVNADSFKVTGAGGGGEQVTIDMGFVPGEGARGTVSLSGRVVELLVTGGKIYVKATADFLSGQGAPKEAAKLLEGKWLLFPKSQSDQFSDFTDSKKFADSVLEHSGKVIQKGETKEINNVPAIGLLDGSKDSADAGTLWIATEGQARPLRIEPAARGGKQGTLDFSYGVDVDLTAPAQEDVIDLGALPGGALGGSAG